GERQSIVTDNLRPGSTMMMEWTPTHPGRWLFHCHLQAHISTAERVPRFTKASDESSMPAPEHAQHDNMDAMSDMAGLVLMVNVKAGSVVAEMPVKSPRKIDLIIEKSAADAKTPTFSCSVQEEKKIVASEDKGLGAPIVLTRGELAEITVINHLDV